MLRFVDKLETGKIGSKYLTRLTSIVCFRDQTSGQILIALGTKSTIAIINYETGEKVFENSKFNTSSSSIECLIYIKSLNALLSQEYQGYNSKKTSLVFLVHLGENFRIERNLIRGLSGYQKDGICVVDDPKAIIATASRPRIYNAQTGLVTFYDLLLRKKITELKVERKVHKIFSDPEHHPNRLIIASNALNKHREYLCPYVYIVDTVTMTFLSKFEFYGCTFTIDSQRSDIGLLGDDKGQISVFRFPEKVEEDEIKFEEKKVKKEHNIIVSDRLAGKFISSFNVCSTDRFEVFFCYGGFILALNFKHHMIQTSLGSRKNTKKTRWKFMTCSYSPFNVAEKRPYFSERLESEINGSLLTNYHSEKGKYIFSVGLERQKITITRFENTKSSMEKIDENERINFLFFHLMYFEDSDDDDENLFNGLKEIFFKVRMEQSVPLRFFKILCL